MRPINAEYAYLQMRQIDRAKSVLDGLPALESRFDVNAVTGAAPGSAGVFALGGHPIALCARATRLGAGREARAEGQRIPMDGSAWCTSLVRSGRHTRRYGDGAWRPSTP
jgi:hypothetical protein